MRHKHSAADSLKCFLDVVEEFEGANTLESEQAMYQQDRVLSCSIPLHVDYLFAEVLGEICVPL
jgi:hypothetical protein